MSVRPVFRLLVCPHACKRNSLTRVVHFFTLSFVTETHQLDLYIFQIRIFFFYCFYIYEIEIHQPDLCIFFKFEKKTFFHIPIVSTLKETHYLDFYTYSRIFIFGFRGSNFLRNGNKLSISSWLTTGYKSVRMWAYRLPGLRTLFFFNFLHFFSCIKNLRNNRNRGCQFQHNRNRGFQKYHK